jgi:hypothetical protein
MKPTHRDTERHDTEGMPASYPLARHSFQTPLPDETRVVLRVTSILLVFIPDGTPQVSGSLFLAWLTTVLSERYVSGGGSWLRPDDLRLTMAVGFTGPYTAFSTFEYESHGLPETGMDWSG